MASNKVRSVCCLMLLTGCTQFAKAQTFAEWFSQKKTLIKYLTTQVAALAQYGAYIKQGYNISQQGLGSIGNWVKGEFDLHGAYYNSLRRVNPEIKRDAKANDCIAYASAIAKAFGSLKADDDEITAYIHSVATKVLDGTDADIAELELVMTDGKADFSDDERLKRLDGIFARLKDRYAFTRSYCGQVRSLLIEREQLPKDIQTQRRLYEIN